jgi:hypothetical protein
MINQMPKVILKIFLTLALGLYLLVPYFHTFADVNTDVFVPPRASDLQFLTVPSPDKSTYEQNEEFEIQITYGSNLSFAAPMTIVAQWSQGTIQGQVHPSEDILDYVVGSATVAYGSTQPVIDTINRTITWTISSFPAQLTDEAMSFHLKTNFNYTASQPITFTIKSHLTDSETTIDAAEITRSYYYNPLGPTPTPTITPTPSSTSNPTSTLTPTPTGILSPISNSQGFIIRSVYIRGISDESIIVYLTTNQQSTSKIAYGISPNSLNQSVMDSSLDTEHQMVLSDLLPDTKYYFRVTATNKNNKKYASDIFVVRTASVSDTPIIAKDTFIVTSSDKILVAPINPALDNLTTREQKTLVIPQSIIYDFRFSLAKVEPVKSIKVVLRKKNAVLGVNTSMLAQLFGLNSREDVILDNSQEITPTSDISTINVKEVGLTEIQPGIFTGRLISNLPIGKYELFAVIADNNGNLTETKLSDVKVIKRFTTLSENEKQPIEAARVYLSFFNSRTKRYDPLVLTLISIVNPSFTDPSGELSIVLPQGKYRALVSDIGYKDKTVDFAIGISENDGFPTVYLEKDSFNPLSIAIYYGRSIRDVYIYYTLQYFTALSKSVRYFNLINAISLGLFIIVTFLSFRFRTHIPLRSIFSYFVYHIRKISGQNMARFYLEGVVLNNKTKIPIGKAQIYLIDSKTHQIIKQTSTNVNGHFFFELRAHKNYEILTVKKGYEVTPFIEAIQETYKKAPLKILLKESESKIGLFNIILTKLIEMPIGFLFEYLLITSFVSEIISIPYFGFQKTFPFMLISGFNLFLWILHLKQKSQGRKLT